VKTAITASIAIALLVCVALPNYRKAVTRSRQKKTMAALRNAATAAEEAGHPVTIEAVDGWGNRVRYRVSAPHYELRAANADGRFESGRPRGPIVEGHEDIVYSDGVFTQFPDGI
jgi:hypothetical protein